MSAVALLALLDLEANLPVMWRGQSNCFLSPTDTLIPMRLSHQGVNPLTL
jgi:hypothetical protein